VITKLEKEYLSHITDETKSDSLSIEERSSLDLDKIISYAAQRWKENWLPLAGAILSLNVSLIYTIYEKGTFDLAFFAGFSLLCLGITVVVSIPYYALKLAWSMKSDLHGKWLLILRVSMFILITTSIFIAAMMILIGIKLLISNLLTILLIAYFMQDYWEEYVTPKLKR